MDPWSIDRPSRSDLMQAAALNEAEENDLIAFLETPWDDRCLDFHQNERAVQTPSRWQVRQPIYSRSVGRWQSYAPHLPQLSAAFGD